MTKAKKFTITLGSFDFVRGFAMICILIGHTLNAGYFDFEAYPFLQDFLRIMHFGTYMIPMFFMISGFGFKEKNVGKILKKTFTDLIVPYLWVMLINIVLYPVLYYLYTGSWSEAASITLRYLLAYLLGIPEYGKQLFGYGILSIFALWFFLTLFVALNVLNLILKIKKTAAQVLLVLSCAVIGYFLLIREINYYCIPQGLIAVSYSYAGYLMKKYKLLERGLHCIWTYAVLLPISAIAFVWGHFDLCLGQFNYGLWDCVLAGFVGAMWMFVGTFFGKFDWFAVDWIRQIGVYTYWILCIHTVEAGLPQWSFIVGQIPNQYMGFTLVIAIKALLIAVACFALKKLARYQYRRRLQDNGK